MTIDLRACRTKDCEGPRALSSDMCVVCLRFTWKHGRRPDDPTESPWVTRARERRLPAKAVA